MFKIIVKLAIGFFLFSISGCAGPAMLASNIKASINQKVEENSTYEMCLELVAVGKRISRGKHYYDICLFERTGSNYKYRAYCPKNSLESGKMTLGELYEVHANGFDQFGSTKDPNEGFFFNPDGNVIRCQKKD